MPVAPAPHALITAAQPLPATSNALTATTRALTTATVPLPATACALAATTESAAALAPLPEPLVRGRLRAAEHGHLLLRGRQLVRPLG